MSQPLQAARTYKYLAHRGGSLYRELFVCGRSLRAQSLVSEMENECLTPEAIAADYDLPVEAVLEAIDYVHANEAFLAHERRLTRQRSIEKGYLKADAE